MFATAGTVVSKANEVSWRLLGNDLPAEGLCSAVLTLRLDDDFAKRGGNAVLYFNFVRKPALVIGASSRPTYEHVNGDLFHIAIDADRLKNAPDHVLKLPMVSQGMIRNVTDAPAGFFLVSRDRDGSEQVSSIDASIDLSVLRETRHSSSQSFPEVRRTTVEGEAPRSASPSAPLVPQPLQYVESPGVVVLNGLPIVCDDTHAATATQLAKAIIAAGGTEPVCLADTNSQSPAIRLAVGTVQLGETAHAQRAEAYTLETTPESGVRITGSDPAGLYYGVQTLIALIANTPQESGSNKLALPVVAIRDAPHFRYRGLHLDVARNFQSTATVCRLLDLMAAYKLNRFHLHLTDDEGWRLAISGLPELTSVGARRGYSAGFREYLPPSFGSGPDALSSPGSGHHTREEFVELLRYAADRHIEVIPEIDLPGHARAAIRAMQVRYDRLLREGNAAAAERYLLRRPDDQCEYESIQMWDDNVIDVRLDSAVEFIEHVVGDIASMHQEAGLPLKTIHFGGDEVPEGCWGDAEDEATEALFTSFMDRCTEIARAQGARAAGWEEVFADRPPDSPIASNGVCYAWNNVWGWGQEDTAYRLANTGTDVVLCGATHLYFDLAHQIRVDEPGYYWAGSTDTYEVFQFRPYRFFEGEVRDRNGNLVNKTEAQDLTKLSDFGRAHVLGIQGHLWGENLTSSDRLDYFSFPRVLALAERAWVGPIAITDDRLEPPRNWNLFAHHLGERELPRLDRHFGGVGYRLPEPVIVSNADAIEVSCAFPGLTIRYTTDGSEPTARSKRYSAPLPQTSGYRFRIFNSRGRGGRTRSWLPSVTPEAEDETK